MACCDSMAALGALTTVANSITAPSPGQLDQTPSVLLQNRIQVFSVVLAPARQRPALHIGSNDRRQFALLTGQVHSLNSYRKPRGTVLAGQQAIRPRWKLGAADRHDEWA